MKYGYPNSYHDKVGKGRRSFVREGNCHGSLIGRKHNRCVVFSENESMVAEALERRNRSWIVKTRTANDLVVELAGSSFHLHKLPMVSRSKYLNRLVFERSSEGAKDGESNIQIHDIPGGTTAFELVIKFCYGWKIDLTAANVAPLYCAANFLEMEEDLSPGNLISKTQAFLCFVIFSSWKDTFKILKSCESISPLAKRLKIIERCSESIAWKACISPHSFNFGEDAEKWLNALANDTENLTVESIGKSWWFEDVSLLRIDHFIEVIESFKRKNMKPELIGSCIAYWTAKWFSQVAIGLEKMTLEHPTNESRRVSVESLIRVLPEEEGSVSCSFLLHIIKIGLLIRIDSELLNRLERRAASILERCRPPDLLVKSYGEDDGVYDVDIVIRVVKSYVSHIPSNSESKLSAVGRLVDGYLTLVARDEKLKCITFQELAGALPENARLCCDNLYRAVDMYLKAHPHLTEEERIGICRSLEYPKLSEEALEHVMKNDRLPLKMSARFILLEQVKMRKSIGSSFQRTKTHASRLVNPQMELKLMKREVEKMKVQLNDLQKHRLRLQKEVKGCFS